MAKVLKVGSEKSTAFIIYNADDSALVVTWVVGPNGVGFWKINQVGIKPGGGIATKDFEKDNTQAAFCGSLSVVGPGTTDLFTSYGYWDDDQVDEEGNIVNKPREIRIYPEKMGTKRKR
jgi:hypothetical protein